MTDEKTVESEVTTETVENDGFVDTGAEINALENTIESGNAAEQAEPVKAESENEEADTSTTEESTADGKKPVQKRIDKLTADMRSAQRERDHWKSLAQESSKEVDKPVLPAIPDPALALDNPEQYQTDMAKYAEDMETYQKGSFEYNQNQSNNEAASTEVENANAELDHVWNSNVETFKADNPDFDKLVARDDNPLSQPMLEIAKRSDNGPEVLLELAKNPTEAMRIYNMNPIQTAHEMGKIEARLALKPKNESQAPEPISSVTGHGEAATQAGEDLPIDDWMKKEQERVANLN